MSTTQNYKLAGVDIVAGESLVDRLRADNPHIGGFAGLYKLDEKRSLVACTDGVGTKIELGIAVGALENLGQDLVAMSVNDLIVCGARPLFFLDYYATGRLDVDTAHRVIHGIQNACAFAGCLLLGGETAEMPGFYEGGKFDLAGFAVGEVFNDRIIDGRSVRAGDAIVGLPSSGFHSNGYSLVRRILRETGTALDKTLPGTNLTYGEALCAPTTLYTREVARACENVTIKAMAHITGGGLSNIGRVLPAGLTYDVPYANIPRPAIVREIQRLGNIPDEEAFAVWNMGMGFVFIVNEGDAAGLLEALPGAFRAGVVRTA